MQQQIEQSLAALSPLLLEVTDESRQHSRGQQTHFKVLLVSRQFGGLGAVARHQKVYACLGDLMRRFHALALHTYTPDEWSERQSVADSPRCLGGSQFD